MIEVTTKARIVVVMGRGADPVRDPRDVIQGTAARSTRVAVFSLGFPVTLHQQAFVAEAVEAAVDFGVELDAEILSHARDLGSRLERGDEVIVDSRGMERRRIDAAIRRAIVG
jgi:hypothetical protein